MTEGCSQRSCCSDYSCFQHPAGLETDEESANLVCSFINRRNMWDFCPWKLSQGTFLVFRLLHLSLWKQDFTGDCGDAFTSQLRDPCRKLPLSTDARSLFSLSMMIQNGEVKRETEEGSRRTYDVMLGLNIHRSKGDFINENSTSPNYGSRNCFQLIGLTVYIRRKSGCVWLPHLKSAPCWPETRLQKRKGKTNWGCNLAAIIIA